MIAKFLIGLVVSFLAAAVSVAAQPIPGKASLNLVFILDGLRPDSINPDDTPNVYRLRLEGVNFLSGHSVFPTVTRVNATAIATGTYPGTNGIVGNTMYVPKVNPNRAFNNDDYKNLLKLDEVTGGNMVLARSMGELLHTRARAARVCCSIPAPQKGSASLLMVTSNRVHSWHTRQTSTVRFCLALVLRRAKEEQRIRSTPR